jgi:hypothetical protein
MKSSDNPMGAANDAPRCKARSKRTGQPCNDPAVTGWNVCRMHGAGGGAPTRPRHGMWKHGGRSKESAHLRALGAELASKAFRPVNHKCVTRHE